MPFTGRKRSYAPSYGRRARRRLPHRRKTGFRKYVRKATSRVYSRPARFAFSRSANRLNTMVAQTIRGMAETKLIPFRGIDWSQPAVTATADGITAVKFVAGSTTITNFPGYLPVGGFNTSQGDTKNDRDGQFVWLKKSTVNVTIQLDSQVPVGERAGPITFRAICFKLKRALSPAGQTVNPNINLFLTNAGNNVGDATVLPGQMTPMDMMLQPLNTNNFKIISDRKFVLCHTQESNSNAEANTQAVQTNMRSYKNLRYTLNSSTKARYPAGASEPVDYDYRYAWAIYAFYPNEAPTTPTVSNPLTWSASIRGTTGFNDV